MNSEETMTTTAVSDADDLELLALLLEEEGIEAVGDSGIPTRKATDETPLSFAQQRLWLVDQMDRGNPAYNIPSAVRLKGRLDVAAFCRAIDKIVERHEVLRTSFVAVGGEPVQAVEETVAFKVDVADLSYLPEEELEEEVMRLAQAEAQRPFDLSRAPLLRAGLLRLSDDEHVALITMHHIISDGWSTGVFVREVCELYAAYAAGREPEAAELPVQYADYAVWQHARLSGETLKQELGYWEEKLGGAAALELPTDRPRPPFQTFGGARRFFTLPASASRRLQALSREEGATLFMTLLAGYKALLHRYSGQSDITVGTPITGRERAELEGLIGFFVNTLALRTEVSGARTFRELLRGVREASLEAFAHRDIPFQKILEVLQPEREMSHAPIFQVWFAFLNAAAYDINLPGLSVEAMDVDSGLAQFDLMLNMTDGGDELSGMFTYNTDLFDEETIARMAGHFRRLLESAAADPDMPLGRLPLLTSEEEERAARGWNDTRAEYDGACFPQLFERQAALTPDAAAVVYGDARLSYRELNARANQLARRLRELGVGPEVKVGVALDRSAELLVSLLATLKAGGVYVPLDRGYPSEHLSFILEDARVRVLLTQEGWRERLPQTDATVVYLDSEGATISGQSEDDLAPEAAADNLAYVIYTSGSTGRPKGVMVTHGGLSNYLNWCQTAYRVEEGAGAPVHSSAAFDLTVTSMFSPLLAGGRVEVVGEEEGVEGLSNVLRRGGDYSLVKITPAHLEVLRQLLPGDAAAGRTRALVVGGEALTWPSLKHWLTHAPATRIINEYGPTETVVGCCVYEAAAGEEGEGGVPIGRPIANTQIYILDRELQLVPAGVRGEMYIGGAGVARGYLNRPGLTAEKFIPDPFSTEPGARLYKTGDLARYLADGQIEFLGRNDHQVKVRGYRIELGRIEAALEGHPKVSECAVVVREDAPGEKRLTAYVVPQAGEALTTSELLRHLKGRLLDYEVPATFVMLDALPLTINGKVDTEALPAPGAARPDIEDGYAEPRTPVERELARIWSEVLGIEQVGVRDKFFELGGHSLLAVQVISRILDTFRVEVTLRGLFEAGTVEGLASVVEAALSEDRLSTESRILPRESGAEAPLSFGQQRLWFIDQLEPGNPAYNLPSVLRLKGRLDVAALERTVNELVRRHEILRTSVRDIAGRLTQVVEPSLDISLPVTDLTHLPEEELEGESLRLAKEEAKRPFDLSRAPLLRVGLLRLRDDEHVVLITLHHIVSDGWSTGVLVREVGELYAAYTNGEESPLSELPVQYADYATWQRERLSGEALKQELEFWEEKLGGAGVLELPTDRPRPPVQTYGGAQETFFVDRATLDRLNQLGQQAGATLFMTLLAAFKVLLSRYTGQSDISVGTPVAGRDRAELEGLIGYFVNTLVLRTDLSDDPGFGDLLGRVRETALGAFAHQDVPFELLVERLQPERDLSRTPLFQAMFILQNAPASALELPGLKLVPLATEHNTTQHDLTLAVEEKPHGLAGFFVYNTDLFDAATVRRMTGHFESLLKAVASNPEERLSSLPLLTDGERRQLLVGWNSTETSYPEDERLHEMFEAQAAAKPESVALVYGAEQLTYAELNRRANRAAHHLRRLGVGPDVLVGVLMERSVEMVVGLLATLKAGGAYVPLDPEYPADRLAFMLRDAGAKVLLTQRRFAAALPPNMPGVLCLDDERERFAGESDSNPSRVTAPADAAYMIYTSGSTGAPKGAVNTHAAICNRLRWMQDAYGLGTQDGVLQKTTFSFDVSVWEFFWPLMTGARLVVAPPGAQHDSAALVELINAQGITTLHFVPSMLRAFLDEPEVSSCTSLRRVICSGEALAVDLQRRFHERLGAELHNLYGPTEAAVDVTYWACLPDDERPSVPIGRPIANTQIYLLDPRLEPVPVGVPGELYIGGAGLARGYHGRPALTAEKFVPDPFSSKPGARLYRTGDLARFLVGGEIEFLGRIDHQVKLRGFRIELGEIEAALLRHEGVRESVVTVREDAPNDKRLVAYYVAGEAQPTVEQLRGHLRELLPEYMMPSAFVALESLPLTQSGKVNRRALPRPSAVGAAQERDYIAPRTGVEEELARLWAEVLGVERVGVNDNFFELGGHSILMIRMRSRLRDAFGVDVPMTDLFKHPTVGSLAKRLTQEPGDEAPAERNTERGRARRASSDRQRQSRLSRRANAKSAEVDDE